MDPVFHIGFHKTATSWLQQTYFVEHPEIALISDSAKPWRDTFLSYLVTTRDDEFHPARARELLEEQVRGLATPLRACRILLVSAERLSGHPCSGGYDSMRIAGRIASSFPEARIVCVVRDPTEAFRSVYKQMVAEGLPCSVDQWCAISPWKTAGFRLDYFDYSRLIGHYDGLLGRERNCVLRYEGLRADPADFTRALCEFLDIEPVSPARAGSRVYPSLPDASIPLVRRLNYFHRTELHPFPLLDLGTLYWPLRRLAVNASGRIPGWTRTAPISPGADVAARLTEYAQRLDQTLKTTARAAVSANEKKARA